MINCELVLLREHPELREPAAEWFHEKWGIPLEEYQKSIDACGNSNQIPQWYLALDGDIILGGLGVIENDFHPRRDLSPNVCAVYVEPFARNQGLARSLLKLACEDMKFLGVDTLYLLTDHTDFYERCGWEYLCPVRGDGEDRDSRMYIHHTVKAE
ncbi:MAG: GNAT family N-acetyltransferase [Acutalibacter sp.]